MKEQGFEKVASKILKQQSKLGKLQGLSVEVKSLSDSVLKRLVKNGALAVVPVTAAALYANKKAKQNAEKWFKGQEKFHKELLGQVNDGYKLRKKLDDNLDNYFGGKPIDRSSEEKSHKDRISSLNKRHADKMKEGKEDWKRTKTTNTVLAGVGTGLPFFINAIRKGLKQEVLITAKYKYGTKVFKVYDASKYEIQSGIDKVILKSITELVSRMKKNVQFPIKEDVTLEEFKQITLTESEFESVMDWL